MSTESKWLSNNPNVPIFSETYFNRHFKLNSSGVQSLANLISASGLSSIFSEPSQWLSSLMFYPFDVNFYGGEDVKLQIGPTETDIICQDINVGISFFNMGEILYEPYFNNFTDYNGYTKLQVWLPYFGFAEINPNDVLNKYIQFRLRVDFGSGQGVWFIGVSNTSISESATPPYASDNDANVRILSEYVCQLGVQIPLGTTNTSEVYRNIIMGAVRASTMTVGAYTMGAMGLASTTATTVTKTVNTARNKKTGRQITTSTNTQTSTKEYDSSNYQYAKGGNACFDTAENALANFHMSVSSDRVNNSVALSNGCESIKLVRFRPKMVDVNEEYGSLYGYPLGEVRELVTLSGYTEISSVHFEGDGFGSATEKEKLALKQAFSNGIIL